MNSNTRLAPGMKKCEVCHEPMASGARTCPHCGKTYTNLSGVVIAVIVGLIIGGAVFIRW
jgi:predicted amidophosphoribosyltransferase